MYRLFDVVFSVVGLLIGSPILIFILILGYFDTGHPLFRQTRVGRNQKPFVLVKFRTMNVDTVSVASHLAPSASVTKLGGILRKTKIDELPQLWNVLLGDMSLVGPRPNLFNQDELIKQRSSRGVYKVRPGITGLAQISNIDMSTPCYLAEVDEKMIREMSISKYFYIIFRTVVGGGSGDAIR